VLRGLQVQFGVKLTKNLRSRWELEATDGRDRHKAPSTLRFRPRRFPYSSIIVDGRSGYISLQGFHWLSRNKVPVFIPNLALNYAYGVLEGECRRAINAVGLEPSMGFLHETSGYQTKQSLVL